MIFLDSGINKRNTAARMELGTLGTIDKTPTSDSTDDGLLRNVKIVSVFFLVRLCVLHFYFIWVRGKVPSPSWKHIGSVAWFGSVVYCFGNRV